MADNVTVDNAALTAYDVRTDEDGSGKHYQLIKLAFGADDVFTRVESGVGLPVAVVGSVTVAEPVSIDDNGGSITVDDGGGSITVDGSFGTEYTEDDPAPANPVGGMMMGRRVDALATQTSADGDVTAVAVTSGGEVYVRHVATVPIGDGNDTVEVLGSGADSTSNTDNELVTAALGYLFNGTGWDRVRGDITNGLDVDVTRVSGTVTVDSELPAAAALTDNFANPTAPAVGAFLMGWDGAAWDRISAPAGVIRVQDDSTISQSTDSISVGDGTNIIAIQTAGADGESNSENSLRTASRGYVWDGTTWDRMPGTAEAGVLVQGGAAHNQAVDGNPVLIGERASTAVPSAVGADGNVVYAWSDRRGARKVVMVDDAGDSIMDGANDALRVNVVAGSGGATQYAEDTASAAGESVIMVGVVRKDSAASLVDADSDRTELQVDASGALRVTGGGGGTEYTEDIATPADPVGGAVLLRRRDTPASEASAAGDWVAQNATQYGAGYVQILTSAGAFVDSFGGGVQYTEGDIDTTITGTAVMWEDASNTLAVASASKPLPVDVGGTVTISDGGNAVSVDDNGGSLTVDGTVSISGTVTVDTEFGAAALITDNFANPTVPGVQAFLMHWDGSGWDRVRGDVATNVQGPDASDAVITGRGVLTGGRASTAAPTAVSADGDFVRTWQDRRGATKTVMVDDDGDSAMDGTNNALRVNVVAGSGSGVSHVDSAAFTVTTDDVVPIAGYRDDTSPDALAEGEAGAVRSTEFRAIHVNLRDASGNEVAVGGGTQYTEDAAAPADPVGTALAMVRDDALSGQVTADGDILVARGTNNGELYVKHVDAIPVTDNGGSLTVDGTVAVSGTVTVSATDLDIRNLDVAQDDVRVGGMAALDAAVADNPVAIGGRASTATPTAVSADGDAVWGWFDRRGAQKVVLVEDNGESIMDNTNDALRVNLAAQVANINVSQTAAWEVVGDVAADAAVPANPLAVGGRASDAVPTAVSADGDSVYAWRDRRGAAKTVMVDDAGDSAMDGANNALRVNVVAGGTSGTQYDEDTASVAADKITMAGVVRQDTAASLVDTDGDRTQLQVDANGRLHATVTITDGTDLAGVSSDGKLRVETVGDEVEDSAVGNGSGGIVVFGVRNDAAAARTDADGDASWIAVDSAGRVGIADLGGSITVDGTVTVNQGAAGSAWEVIGDVAHDAAAPANPVVVGAQMETIADSAPGTRAGTDGDAVKLASLDGAIFQAGRGPQSWQTRLASTSTVQTDGSIHAAPGAGLSLYVTDIIFSIGVATASSIFFEEGASTVLGPWYLEAIAGRGMALHFQTPFKVTANTALTVTNTGATTYSILVLGFTAPG